MFLNLCFLKARAIMAKESKVQKNGKEATFERDATCSHRSRWNRTKLESLDI